MLLISSFFPILQGPLSDFFLSFTVWFFFSPFSFSWRCVIESSPASVSRVHFFARPPAWVVHASLRTLHLCARSISKASPPTTHHPLYSHHLPTARPAAARRSHPTLAVAKSRSGSIIIICGPINHSPIENLPIYLLSFITEFVRLHHESTACARHEKRLRAGDGISISVPCRHGRDFPVEPFLADDDDNVHDDDNDDEQLHLTTGRTVSITAPVVALSGRSGCRETQ